MFCLRDGFRMRPIRDVAALACPLCGGIVVTDRKAVAVFPQLRDGYPPALPEPWNGRAAPPYLRRRFGPEAGRDTLGPAPVADAPPPAAPMYDF